jgi:hypothetical protein
MLSFSQYPLYSFAIFSFRLEHAIEHFWFGLLRRFNGAFYVTGKGFTSGALKTLTITGVSTLPNSASQSHHLTRNVFEHSTGSGSASGIK